MRIFMKVKEKMEEEMKEMENRKNRMRQAREDIWKAQEEEKA